MDSVLLYTILTVDLLVSYLLFTYVIMGRALLIFHGIIQIWKYDEVINLWWRFVILNILSIDYNTIKIKNVKRPKFPHICKSQLDRNFNIICRFSDIIYRYTYNILLVIIVVIKRVNYRVLIIEFNWYLILFYKHRYNEKIQLQSTILLNNLIFKFLKKCFFYSWNVELYND